ncbi:hypothetical protein B0A49_01311 [Cryomyces minteri]|uniref:RNA-dependent RNA polymerase n=1 Tax=Cryomyces minteri TaxID=331657 RepID=A0A4U0XT68_9PEZI|nr:hypothetical protein B0A49_01311 [Cryomyces minteri]
MNMLESDRGTNILPSNISTSLNTLLKSDEQVLMLANEQHFPCDADDLPNAQLFMELERAAVSAEGLGVTVRNAPEQHQVKRLPDDGLFIEDMPSDVKRLPFGLQFECVRVAQACRASLEDLCTPQQPYEIKDHQKQWADFEKSWPDTKLPQQVPSKIWASVGSNYENVSLKGSLEFNRSNNGPLFRLVLEPFRREKSCRFQRAFGGDRFLYLDVPSFRDLPKHLKGQQDNLLIRYREWLGTEKCFLGRTWRVLLVSPKKAKKKNRGKKMSARQPEIAHAQQLVLFATGGSDLTIAAGTSFQSRASCSYRGAAASVEKVINWFMPVKKNAFQPYCKAYARLELGFSKTLPALVFMPSQVRHVPDTITDGSPESTEFDDPRLKWEASPEEQRIMNDGCSRISAGAAKKMWRDNSLDGPVPSAFQGRIGGAKGVWTISAPSEMTDLEHTNIWIEITPSQMKFKPHDTDLDDATFDSNRLTFDMLKFSGSPKPSILHMSFLPILQDRGIPKGTLMKFVRDHMDHDRKEVLAAVADPVALRRWVHSQNAWLEESQKEQGITWRAALPRLTMEKVNMLLEFWLCWEPDLICSFKNAPPPYNPLPPEHFGIKIDRTKLGEVASGPFQAFLTKSFDFRCRRELLGQVTIFHEKLSYAENSIDSPGINPLADLHDHLVDSSKNGYTFDHEAWQKYITSSSDIGIKNPKKPAYKVDFDSISGSTKLESVRKLEMKPGAKRPKYNPNHIIDHLVFEIIEPHIKETLEQVKASFTELNTWDSAFAKNVYTRELTSSDRVIRDELETLVENLKKIGETRGTSDYNDHIAECHTQYVNLSPVHTSHPVISRWLVPTAAHAPTTWSLIKAAALFTKHHTRYNFVFDLAGRELCYLKAHSVLQTRSVVEPMYSVMKFRRAKRLLVDEEVPIESDNDEIGEDGKRVEDAVQLEWDQAAS